MFKISSFCGHHHLNDYSLMLPLSLLFNAHIASHGLSANLVSSTISICVCVCMCGGVEVREGGGHHRFSPPPQPSSWAKTSSMLDCWCSLLDISLLLLLASVVCSQDSRQSGLVKISVRSCHFSVHNLSMTSLTPVVRILLGTWVVCPHYLSDFLSFCFLSGSFWSSHAGLPSVSWTVMPGPWGQDWRLFHFLCISSIYNST